MNEEEITALISKSESKLKLFADRQASDYDAMITFSKENAL